MLIRMGHATEPQGAWSKFFGGAAGSVMIVVPAFIVGSYLYSAFSTPAPFQAGTLFARILDFWPSFATALWAAAALTGLFARWRWVRWLYLFGYVGYCSYVMEESVR